MQITNIDSFVVVYTRMNSKYYFKIQFIHKLQKKRRNHKTMTSSPYNIKFDKFRDNWTLIPEHTAVIHPYHSDTSDSSTSPDDIHKSTVPEPTSYLQVSTLSQQPAMYPKTASAP